MIENLLYAGTSYLAAIILSLLAARAFSVREIPAARPFGALMTLGAVHTFLQAVAYPVLDLPLRTLLAEWLVVPGVFIPVAIIALALEYSSRGAWMTRANLLRLLLLPIILSALSVTSTHHQLFRYNYSLVPLGSVSLIMTSKGPGYWVFLCFTFILILVACALLVLTMKENKWTKANNLAILSSILIPFLGELIGVFNISPIPGYNFSGPLFVVSGLILAQALLKGNLLKIVPIARHSVVDYLDDLIIVFDNNHQLIDFNEAAQAACGLSPQFLGKIPIDLAPEWNMLFQNYLQTRVYKEEFHITSNGRKQHYELTIEPILDQRKRPLGRLYYLHNVSELNYALTQLARTNQALRENKVRTDNIIEGSNIGTWEWNIQTGEVVLNERWAEIIGSTLAELAPISVQTWKDNVHPLDLQASSALLDKVFAHQLEIYDIECRIKHRDGSWVWVQERGKVLEWDQDGKPLLMAGSHTDITERKRTLEALRLSEEKYRVLFEMLPTGVTLTDETGRIIATNQAGQTILGLSAQDQTSRRIDGQEWSFIRPDGSKFPEAEFASVRALKEKRPVRQVEMGFRRSVDEITWINVNASPLPDLGVVVTYEDISARKQAEEALRQSEQIYRSMFEKKRRSQTADRPVKLSDL